jgi:hypothetical protein
VARSVVLALAGLLVAILPPGGHARASEAGAGRPSRVRFREIRTLPGALFPHREPWSVRGQTIVFNAVEDGGLHAFDLARPDEPPRQLTGLPVEAIAWSPDGAWLLGRQRLEWGRNRPERLVAIPLSGSRAPEELVRADREFGPFFWATDGHPYYYSLRTKELVRVDAPRSWTAEHLSPLPNHDCYVAVPGTRASSSPAVVRMTDAGPHIRMIVCPIAGAGRFVIRDEVPGRDILLCWFFPLGGPSCSIVQDVEGHAQATFRQEDSSLEDGTVEFGFSPTSISSDGRYLVGSRTVEDGHRMHCATPILADASGTWEVPIDGAPDPVEAHLSREGMALAIQGLNTGAIHVGQLEIE